MFAWRCKGLEKNLILFTILLPSRFQLMLTHICIFVIKWRFESLGNGLVWCAGWTLKCKTEHRNSNGIFLNGKLGQNHTRIWDQNHFSIMMGLILELLYHKLINKNILKNQFEITNRFPIHIPKIKFESLTIEWHGNFHFGSETFILWPTWRCALHCKYYPPLNQPIKFDIWVE